MKSGVVGQTLLVLTGMFVLAGCAKEREVTRRTEPSVSLLAHPRPPARNDVAAATESRVKRAPLAISVSLPLPITPRRHLGLDGPIKGSLSIGTVTHGYLFQGETLPLVGDHHRVTTAQSMRGTNHGSRELVETLQRAAAAVAKRFPGAVLQVGNMAKGGGGDIPWSVSHNNGRDVDIAFYLLAPDGSQPPLDDLVRLNARGTPADVPLPYRFDPARNWALIEALLTDEAIRIQYIFVSNPLKAMLLEHARSKKKPASLLATADIVLRQPGGALPHDDHFHVRVFCPESDVAEGCVDTGRTRPGVELHPEVAAARVPKLVPELRSKKPERRAAAVFLLATLGARTEAPAIAKRLRDKDRAVRLEALRALVTLRADDQAERIQKLVAKEKDGEVAREGISALVQLGTTRARAALVELVSDNRMLVARRGLSEESFTVRERAALGLARLAARSAVPTLVAALDDSDEPTRSAVEAALALLTNHTTLDVLASMPAATAAQGGADDTLPTSGDGWRAWLASHQKRSPVEWLLDGFRSAGFSVDALDARAVPELTRAILDDRDHISFNAQRGLMAIARSDPGSLSWSRDDAYTFWSRWASSNDRKLQAECKRLERVAAKASKKTGRGTKKGARR